MKQRTASWLIVGSMWMVSSAACAEDLLLRIRVTSVGGNPNYEVVHAQKGSFSHHPQLPSLKNGDLVVIGRDAAGKEIARMAVRNPSELHAEQFDPVTKQIVSSHSTTRPDATTEVRMAFPANLASIDLQDHRGGPGTRELAGTPVRRMSRLELDALIDGKVPLKEAPRSGAVHQRALNKAAVPTGSTMLLQNGPSNGKWDMVMIGDGYASADQAKWVNDANTMMNAILADPLFAAHRNQINIRRIDITSLDSGVTEGGVSRRTALGTQVGCFNIPRLVCADDTLVANAVAAQTTADGRDLVVVVANSASYGGSGGPNYAVFTMGPQSIEVALHEIGHSAFQLADEYVDAALCTQAAEPVEFNATLQNTRATTKWNALIAASTVVPTPTGYYPAGTVGLFNGGRYCASGTYRPTENSRMRTLGVPWYAVNSKRADDVFAYYSGTTASGNLSGTGGTATFPNASPGYVWSAGGLFTLNMAASNPQFTLTLYRYAGSGWVVAAQSQAATANKYVSYQGTAGYYYAQIRSTSGAGNYTLVYTFPP